MRLSSRDLYRLRHSHHAWQRATLQAQVAQQALGELLLELERCYGILGTEGNIEINTGEIINTPQEASDDPDRDAHAGPARPAR